MQQVFKYLNFNFICEEDIENLKIFDFIDRDEIYDDFSVQKRRGRPKGKSYLDKGDNAKDKSKKKNDNNRRMHQLDNPFLEPTSHETFFISLPLRNVLSQSDIESLHDSAIENEVKGCWKKFDIEKKFAGINVEEAESSADNTSTNANDDNAISNANDDTITIANLGSHAPFQNEFIIKSFLAKASKGYRLGQVETKDPNRLGFKCNSQGCYYTANFLKLEDGFHLENQTYHTCPNPVIVSTESLQEVIFKTGKSTQLDAKYMAQINKKFNL